MITCIGFFPYVLLSVILGLECDQSVIRKVSTFIFIDKHSQGFVPFIVAEQNCLAIVGDYVAIGKDFASIMKNLAYTLVHENFKEKCPKQRDYVCMH